MPTETSKDLVPVMNFVAVPVLTLRAYSWHESKNHVLPLSSIYIYIYIYIHYFCCFAKIVAIKSNSEILFLRHVPSMDIDGILPVVL
jgi:Fe2+ transport system protein B